MVTRRNFLGMLAALPAVTVLAGSGLRLPRTEEVEVEVDISPYLASPYTWYIKTEHQDGLKYFNRVSSANLTEESLEQLTDNAAFAQYRIQPRKLIVHPDMAARARQIIEYRPGFVERLWWRLMPAP